MLPEPSSAGSQPVTWPYGANTQLPLCFSRACLAESMLEVVYLLILLAATELGFEPGSTHVRVQEEGWYMVVSLFTNLQRLWVLRGLAWRLARQGPTVEDHNGPVSTSMDSFSGWWCFFISLASCFWYCVQASQWTHDAWNCSIAATLGFINLVICGGWILILRIAGRKVESATLAVHVFHRGCGVDNQDTGEAVTCVVCLLELEQREELGRLPCGHTFHRRCIEEWLAVRAQCPMRCPGGNAGGAQPQQGFSNAVGHRHTTPAVPREPLPSADLTAAISSTALQQADTGGEERSSANDNARYLQAVQARGFQAAVRSFRQQSDQVRPEQDSVVTNSSGPLGSERSVRGQSLRQVEAHNAVVIPVFPEAEAHQEARQDFVEEEEEVSMPRLTHARRHTAPNHNFGGVVSI